MGDFLLEKAAQCRRLAAMIINQNDPAIHRLLSIADEFEAQARQAEAQTVQTAIDRQTSHEPATDMAVAALKPPETEQPSASERLAPPHFT